MHNPGTPRVHAKRVGGPPRQPRGDHHIPMPTHGPHAGSAFWGSRPEELTALATGRTKATSRMWGKWLDKAKAHGLAEAERLLRQDRHPFGPPHRSSSMSGSASSCHSSLWTLLRRLGKKQRLLRLPRYQLIWDGRQGGDCNLEEWETSLPKLSDGRVPQPLIALLEHTPNRVEPAEGSIGLASAGSTGQ